MFRSVLLFCLALASISRSAYADPETSAEKEPAPPIYWSLSVSGGTHYSTGKYGESESTDILYVPTAIRAELESASLELTVPYLRIHGPDGIFAVVTNPSTQGSHTEEGLGDLYLAAAYSFAPPIHGLPFTEIKGQVKFPTADEDRALGTGEYDYLIDASFTWALGSFVPFFAVGYDFLGDTVVAVRSDGSSTGFELNDVFRGSAGCSYRFLDSLYGGGQVGYRAASAAGSGEVLDFVPFVSWRPSPSWSVDAYITAGAAKGSPDIGGGLQLAYRYP